MVTIYHSNARSEQLATVDKLRSGAWVHVVAPDEAEIAELSKKFELDADLLRDAVDLYESPRIERSDGSVYVYTRYYHADNGVINATEPLLIVYRPTYILTLTRVKGAVLDPLINGKERVVTTQKTKTLLQILEAVNGSYAGYMTRATKQILRVRSQLRRTDISSEVLLNFIEVEDDLNEFISALQPQSVVLRGLLGGKFLPLYEEDKDLVEDLSLGTGELIELVKSRLKTLIGIRQAYEAIAATELNKTFRRLTSISIFLMVPTIIFSFYGMNVHLPFERDGLAFWYIMALVAIFSFGMVYLFRRKRWL